MVKLTKLWYIHAFLEMHSLNLYASTSTCNPARDVTMLLRLKYYDILHSTWTNVIRSHCNCHNRCISKPDDNEPVKKICFGLVNNFMLSIYWTVVMYVQLMYASYITCYENIYSASALDQSMNPLLISHIKCPQLDDYSSKVFITGRALFRFTKLGYHRRIPFPL